jgi:hypothetical protein
MKCSKFRLYNVEYIQAIPGLSFNINVMTDDFAFN